MNPTDNPGLLDGERDASPSPARSAFLFGLKALTTCALVGAAATLLYVTLDNVPESPPVAVAPPPLPIDAAAEALNAPPAPAAELINAQAHVRELEKQLADKELELGRIADAAGVPGERRAKGSLVAEVARIEANLQAARKVRDQLKFDLKAALAEVEAQSQQTALARGDAHAWHEKDVQAEWRAFTASVANSFCDHGTRKGVDKCQASLDAYFTDERYQRFAACERSGGATPTLLSEPRGDHAPTFAEALGSNAFLPRQEWYVVYCDPTLPEKGDEVARNDAAPD